MRSASLVDNRAHRVAQRQVEQGGEGLQLIGRGGCRAACPAAEGGVVSWGMKKCLPLALFLFTLVSCSKSEDAKPVAPSLVGVWSLTSQTIKVTPKSGGASTTYTQPVVPNTVKLTYRTDGTYTVVWDKSVSAANITTTANGTYSYSGNTITYVLNSKTSTAQVDVLTNTDLTHVETTENLAGTQVNVTTNTYTR